MNSDNSKTVTKKLLASFMSTAVFIMVAHPQTYKLVDDIFSYFTNTSGSIFNDNCPTVAGTFVHLIVFFVLSFLSMHIRNNKRNEDDRLSKGLMVKYSFYGSLIWFLLSNNKTYQITNGIINGLSSQDGCPTNNGVIVHAIVYFAILYGVMTLPKDR
jgi:hypothetical protein